MTADQLVRAVRLQFIKNDRHDPILAKMPIERRREFVAANRSVRAHRRVLLKSPQFQQLAAGFLKARVGNSVSDLVSLVTWLAVLNSLTKGKVRPQQFAERVEEQARTRAKILSDLRSAAAALSEEYAKRVRQLANEIENDILAIHRYDIGAHIVSTDNIGRRGAAATLKEGAWRGLFIRELRDRLPALEHFKPDEYAMMAHLLSWAGISDVSSVLVRSVLGRGHT